MVLPFSSAVSRNGFVFTSGQVYLTEDGKLLKGTIVEQTHQVMKNLQKILLKEGFDFIDVVKTTIYITDMSVYQQVNEVYASYFKQPYPAREMVCVKELPLGAKLEISMIAARE
jgi:2-iminobutanoate/2-iminopropanoate deaminase